MHDKSLLFKWLWSYMLEVNEVWKSLINAIYGNKEGWRPLSLHLNARGGMWKYISRLWGELLEYIKL